jgi:hypothetical protein
MPTLHTHAFEAQSKQIVSSNAWQLEIEVYIHVCDKQWMLPTKRVRQDGHSRINPPNL